MTVLVILLAHFQSDSMVVAANFSSKPDSFDLTSLLMVWYSPEIYT